MFGTLGGPELFLILVVALIVFGPRKLPEIGKSLGRMMNEFKKASNEFRQTLEDEVESDKRRETARIEAPASATFEAASVAEAEAPPDAPPPPPEHESAADLAMAPAEATVSREPAPSLVPPK